VDRRSPESEKPEGLDQRTPSITPGEVYEVYQRFVAMIDTTPY
jgi:hypothetical protein